MPTPQDILFARCALDHGLLTDEEVERALAEQKAVRERGGAEDLHWVVERLGMLSPIQVAIVKDLMVGREWGRDKTSTPGRDSSAPSQRTVSDGLLPGPAAGANETVADTRTPDERQAAAQAREAAMRTAVGGYTILREVGRGGMGIVYEAVQTGLNRRVALKIVVQRDMDPEALERLKREAMAAAKLAHPNVVRVFDCGEAEGMPYFAMEFVPGTSLAQVVGDPDMTFTRAARLILQAAEGLRAAHEAGIMHRDIKPGNLLLTEDDRVVVTDFGLARDQSVATITKSNEVLGTPRYMSPEQANGVRDEIDHRTDVYSLGATLYELATGHPIFEDAGGNIFHQVLNKDPKSPRKHRPDLPVDLETVILKATQKEAKDRYPTMAAFAEDLQRYLAGDPVHARRARWPERVWRRMKKHPRTSAGVAVAAVLVAAVVSWLAELGERRREEAVREGRRREAVELLHEAKRLTADLTVKATFDTPIEQIERQAAEAYGRLEKSLAMLQRAGELDPRNVAVWEELVRVARTADRVDVGISACERWLEVEPGSDWARYLKIRLMEQATGVGTQLPLYLELESSPATTPVLELATAWIALVDGDPIAAINALPMTLAEAIHGEEVVRIVAIAHGQCKSAGDHLLATKLLQRVTGTAHAVAADYRILAYWLRTEHRPDEAYQAIANAMALSPERTHYLVDLAALCIDTGRVELASLLLNRAIEQRPDLTSPFVYRADLRISQEDFAGAEQDCLAALRLEPDNSLASIKLLQIHLRRHDRAGDRSAQQTYRLAVEKGAFSASARQSLELGVLCELVDTQLELGELADAHAVLTEGIQRFPEFAGLHYLLGQYHHRTKNYAAAVESLERAILLDPAMVKAHVWASRSYAAAGNLKKSVGHLTAAIKLEPDNRDLKLKRAMRCFQALDFNRGLRDIEAVALQSSLAEVETLRAGLVGEAEVPEFKDLDGRVRSLARQLLPRLGGALAQHGLDLLDKSDRAGAKAAFERARVVDPTLWQPHYGLAAVCVAEGEWEVAVFRIEKAIELGFRDLDKLTADPRFLALLTRPEYKRAAERLARLCGK